MDERQSFNPRNSGCVPRKRPAGLHDDPDNGLSAGREKAVRRIKKVGNFHIFEAGISRTAAQRRLIDELLSLFGGRSQPVMAHLIESGKLTLADVKEAEKTLRRLQRKDESK